MSKPVLRHRVVFAIVAIAVGGYYLWIAGLAADASSWNKELDGYYDFLARAFTHGQLHLLKEPSPELLAQPNPRDPMIDPAIKLHDAVLFNRHYYLYHGAGPAMMAFVPWLLITGRDLPESMGTWLFCFGGFLFSCGALLAVLEMADSSPPPTLLAMMMIALGACQCAPYLLSRPLVYEVAIAAGYFCISGAVFFLVRSIRSARPIYWLMASGCLCGVAVACRPHLGLAGGISLAGVALLWPRDWRKPGAFALPFALAGLAIACYNYARFANPFEFGIQYVLSDMYREPIGLSTRNIFPGLYFLLFCAPDFSTVFPWMTVTVRHLFTWSGLRLPQGYFVESGIGSLYVAPLLAGILLIRHAGGMVKRDVRIVLWVVFAYSAAILAFLTANGFTAMRYEADYVPHALLAALICIGIVAAKGSGWRRTALRVFVPAFMAFGVVVSLALAIMGPGGYILDHRPEVYLRVARWFSPVESRRPLLNPRVDIDFSAEFTAAQSSLEPLLKMGLRTHGYYLSEEHSPKKVRFVSQADSSVSVHEVDRPPGNSPIQVRVRYSPESGSVIVLMNGEEVLDHPIQTLITAPSQITIGENVIDFGVDTVRFTGRILKSSAALREAAAR